MQTITVHSSVHLDLQSKSCLTPVTAEELGNSLAILKSVRPCKDGVEALIVVHVRAGHSAACLACVERMTLQSKFVSAYIPSLQSSQGAGLPQPVNDG